MIIVRFADDFIAGSGHRHMSERVRTQKRPSDSSRALSAGRRGPSRLVPVGSMTIPRPAVVAFEVGLPASPAHFMADGGHGGSLSALDHMRKRSPRRDLTPEHYL